MRGAAYWIDPRGRIVDSTVKTHIQHIIDNPSKFGMNRQTIEQIYVRHGERVGQEGEAREEIIERVLKQGFIRIRLYLNRRWSVTLHRLGRRERKALAVWAEEAAKNQFAGPFMDVRILELFADRLTTTSIDEIRKGFLGESVVEGYEPRFVAGMSDFGIGVSLREVLGG